MHQTGEAAQGITSAQKNRPLIKELCLFPSNKVAAAILLQIASAEVEREQAAKKEQLERALRVEVGELVARWKRLAPLFEYLEQLPASPGIRKEDHPETPFPCFERNGVGYFLLTSFEPAIVRRLIAGQQPQLDVLKRKAAKIYALLEESLTLPLRLSLEKLYRKTLTDLEKQQERQHQLSRTCPTVSAAITDLTTYLWSCYSVRACCLPAKIYTCVGVIIWCISWPTCLACGQQHHFKDWRRVRARDRLKGKRGFQLRDAVNRQAAKE